MYSIEEERYCMDKEHFGNKNRSFAEYQMPDKFFQNLQLQLNETTGEICGLIPDIPSVCGRYFFHIRVKSSKQ